MTLLEQAKKFIDQNQNCRPKVPMAPDGIDRLDQWIVKQSRLPWLELHGIAVPYEQMRAEAQNLRHRFVDHRGDNGTGWKSLCIHGISAEHTNSAASYGFSDDTAPYDWTDIQEQCPVTVDFFRNHFHYQSYQRVRFMLLEPGGYIEPHQDSDTYYVASAINMSLTNPLGCSLTTTEGSVPFRDSGSMFYFNTSYQHAAYNGSDQDRFHIIVHGRPDGNYWKNIIEQSYWSACREQS